MSNGRKLSNYLRFFFSKKKKLKVTWFKIIKLLSNRELENEKYLKKKVGYKTVTKVAGIMR